MNVITTGYLIFPGKTKKYRIHPEPLLEMSQHDGVGISIFPANHRAKYIFGKSLKHHFQMVGNSYHFYMDSASIVSM